MCAFRSGRSWHRSRYDMALVAAGALLPALEGADPHTVVCTSAQVLRRCIVCDQALRAYINHPTGDILAARLERVETIVAVAVALGRQQGLALSRTQVVGDLVAVPAEGTYLELILTALAPAIDRLQARGPDEEVTVPELLDTGFLDDACSSLFQGQADLLAITLSRIAKALRGRPAMEFVSRMEARRAAARRKREDVLARLSPILPAHLSASLIGCLHDIDELSMLDNREDTARSLAFDGREDYLLRRTVFLALTQLLPGLPKDVFEISQDALLELVEGACATTS